MDIAERGADRQSDDSSRRADSDSHPENWTDHEANDATPSTMAGSPPKNEQQQQQQQSTDRRSKLFARDRPSPGSNKSKKHSLSVDLKPSHPDLNTAEVIISSILFVVAKNHLINFVILHDSVKFNTMKK